MTDRSRAEVVVGGGVVGCAATRFLAPDHDVLLVERDRLAGETTGKASGLITNPANYRDRPELARYATEFFRALDDTGEFAFTPRESVELVPPEPESRSADFESTAHMRVDGVEERTVVDD